VVCASQRLHFFSKVSNEDEELVRIAADTNIAYLESGLLILTASVSVSLSSG
jgi:hypothetical protein